MLLIKRERCQLLSLPAKTSVFWPPLNTHQQQKQSVISTLQEQTSGRCLCTLHCYHPGQSTSQLCLWTLQEEWNKLAPGSKPVYQPVPITCTRLTAIPQPTTGGTFVSTTRAQLPETVWKFQPPAINERQISTASPRISTKSFLLVEILW